MEYELKNKVVVITGGAIGIGACVVEMLLEEGVKHVAFLDILEQEGTKRQNTLAQKYGAGRVQYHRCDVTKEEELESAFQAVLDKFGIDIVINNAAVMNDKIYKKEIDINVTALVTSTFKAIEAMRLDGGGRGGCGGRGGLVVNVSSVAAMMHTHTLPVYFATKAFVMHFTSSIGEEEHFVKTGVRVMTVCFGRTDTSLLAESKLASYHDDLNPALRAVIESVHNQQPESAARGVLEVCRRGASGSVWLAQADRPARDVTAIVQQAYKLMKDLLV
ncbi:15-hydroxyprostaglandin dehydrogenase [NAD(+)]-like [Aricia agestis]|uniref:15-hydroxyprostaglandin dehydrogenase [NAD(+)]-like n=1 Tax=Aricia agestis TaxID=91739 RepID=UPI001C20B53D|nr:15-hydroxyprostaglandin dehydrogenase [NAD(+)]-like [Aricia agestis]